MNKVTPILLAFTVCAACGVSKSKYTSLEDQMKTCQDDLDKTKADKAACDAHAEQLKSGKEELSQELETKTKTYDQLVGSLKSEISQGKVKISEMEGRLTVNLIDKILFDSGSATIQEEGKGALTKIGDVLKSVEGKRIQVEGHTDNMKLGPKLAQRFPTNWELSTARATAVVKYLAEVGIPETKLTATGYSMFSPVGTNDTPEGRAQNRRIEIVLVPELKTVPATPADAPSPPVGENK